MNLSRARTRIIAGVPLVAGFFVTNCARGTTRVQNGDSATWEVSTPTVDGIASADTGAMQTDDRASLDAESSDDSNAVDASIHTDASDAIAAGDVATNSDAGPESPMTGVWVGSKTLMWSGSTVTAMATQTLTLNADSSGSQALSGPLSNGCMMSQTLDGVTWSADGTNLTLTGDPNCTGGIFCSGTMIAPCDATNFSERPQAYSLSPDGRTLTLAGWVLHKN
jgi:hypothetical protein